MKVAFFDLETSDLKADIGRILVGSVYSYPEGTMKTFRLDEVNNGERMWDDRKIARLIRDELNKHQLVVGWYSKGFDLPFLSTRLANYNMDRIKRHFHLDLIWYARGWSGIKPRNSRLATVAEFFNLGERKMAVDVEVWVRAMHGDTKAFKILSERCESDVRLTEKIYWKLLPFVSRLERYGA